LKEICKYNKKKWFNHFFILPIYDIFLI
jgi:hypothetical protein